LSWIALGYIGLQFSSNVAHGPMQGLLPDRAPPEQLGRASGIKNLMDMAGLVAASLIIGRAMQPEATRPLGPIGVVAVVLAAGAGVTLLGVREEPALERRKATGGWFDAFRIDLHAHTSYAWLIGSRFFYLFGVYGIQVFAQYYIRDVLADADPIQLTGDLMATITLTLICFTLVGGWLGDRVGHKKISTIASAVGALGCFMLLWARTPLTLLIFGALLGAGVGLFLTANWALCNRLAPSAQAGMFLGLTNLATGGAGALARLQGPFIDLMNNANPGTWWGYSELFLTGAVCTLISAVLLVKVSAR